MNDENKTTTTFKVNRIICGALIAGVVFFLLVGFLVQNKYQLDYDPEDFMLPVVFMILIMGATTSLFLVKRFSEPSETSDLSAKLANYQTRMIITMALLEGPALLAIFQFLSTGSLLYVFVSMVSILFMIYLFPSKQKFISEYSLSMEERIVINKMN
jgi:cobalamin synthase